MSVGAHDSGAAPTIVATSALEVMMRCSAVTPVGPVASVAVHVAPASVVYSGDAVAAGHSPVVARQAVRSSTAARMRAAGTVGIPSAEGCEGSVDGLSDGSGDGDPLAEVGGFGADCPVSTAPPSGRLSAQTTRITSSSRSAVTPAMTIQRRREAE